MIENQFRHIIYTSCNCLNGFHNILIIIRSFMSHFLTCDCTFLLECWCNELLKYVLFSYPTQWTSKICCFLISKYYFWWQIHFKSHQDIKISNCPHMLGHTIIVRMLHQMMKHIPEGLTRQYSQPVISPLHQCCNCHPHQQLAFSSRRSPSTFQLSHKCFSISGNTQFLLKIQLL